MVDLTVAAVPGFFATMEAERRYLVRRDGDRPSQVTYTAADTRASLTMGTLSLVVPLLTRPVMRRLAPQRTRAGAALVIVGAAAATLTTAADVLARRRARQPARRPASTAGVPTPRCAPGTGVPPTDATTVAAAPPASTPPTGAAAVEAWLERVAPDPLVHRVRRAGARAAVVALGVATCAAWQTATVTSRFWRVGRRRDLGGGAAATALAVLGWDAIYYWNHRWMHTTRAMWAHHVVHHSSQRFNLSTALRQPVAEALGVFVPYGLLCLGGIRPAQIEVARGVNLLYQYWFHTDAVRRLGPLEEVLNTASHHRVHHGSNQRYLDRNHGSILIVWDRLFGTFAREDDADPVVYGLTKNVGSYSPWRIATHEYGAMLDDVAAATTWHDRISFVVRGPGWANRRRAELAPLTPG